MNTFEIYTDGACWPNPGPGGWAFVVIEVASGIVFAEHAGHLPETTNNRAEMTAIIEALRWLKPGVKALIRSDSTYAVYVLSGKWKSKNKKNAGLVVEGRALVAEKLARLLWIKGHAGHEWNERADELAEAMVRDEDIPREPYLAVLMGERCG